MHVDLGDGNAQRFSNAEPDAVPDIMTDLGDPRTVLDDGVYINEDLAIFQSNFDTSAVVFSLQQDR